MKIQLNNKNCIEIVKKKCKFVYLPIKFVFVIFTKLRINLKAKHLCNILTKSYGASHYGVII